MAIIFLIANNSSQSSWPIFRDGLKNNVPAADNNNKKPLFSAVEIHKYHASPLLAIGNIETSGPLYMDFHSYKVLFHNVANRGQGGWHADFCKIHIVDVVATKLCSFLELYGE